MLMTTLCQLSLSIPYVQCVTLQFPANDNNFASCHSIFLAQNLLAFNLSLPTTTNQLLLSIPCLSLLPFILPAAITTNQLLLGIHCLKFVVLLFIIHCNSCLHECTLILLIIRINSACGCYGNSISNQVSLTVYYDQMYLVLTLLSL